jgi:hypothetical protein
VPWHRPRRRRVCARRRDPIRAAACSATPALIGAPRSWRERAGLAGLAAGLATALLYGGPPGTDFAEHAFQEWLYATHGFSLWNNLWYSGRYSFVTYSLLYYPLAALVGIRLLAGRLCGRGRARLR